MGRAGGGAALLNEQGAQPWVLCGSGRPTRGVTQREVQRRGLRMKRGRGDNEADGDREARVAHINPRFSLLCQLIKL